MRVGSKEITCKKVKKPKRKKTNIFTLRVRQMKVGRIKEYEREKEVGKGGDI